MSKNARAYTPEFKREAVRLLESCGRPAAQIERELGIGDGCLLRWKKKVAREGEQAFPGHGRMSPDQDRIRKLERENLVLRQEREILKRAIAIFSCPKG